MEVFWFHVKRLGWTAKGIASLGHAAGAEVWVQRRVVSQAKEQRGVNWHYDKDEDLLDQYGLFVHPLVATATYLTAKGAPLVVLSSPLLSTAQDGEPRPDTPSVGAARSEKDAFIAFPTPGLHVAFRGNLLHGAPPFLEARKGERLALLLNVWVQHRPVHMQPCPVDLGRKTGPVLGSECHPRRQLRIRARKVGSALEPISLTPDVGSWTLEGLKLPHSLPPDGVWRLRQQCLAISQPKEPRRRGAKRKRGEKP